MVYGTGGVAFADLRDRPALNWILGAEYLYYQFDDNLQFGGSFFNPITGAPQAFYECGTGANCANFNFRKLEVNTGRVRLSYQFQP
jgi:hypothetical protein